MAQNLSGAVVNSRKEPPDSLEYFPTMPWATRALCEMLVDASEVREPERSRRLGLLRQFTAAEPCCGEGYMARPLAEYFGEVTATDVMDYGTVDWAGGWRQHETADFLTWWDRPRKFVREPPDFVITNPPFRPAVDMVLMGLRLARVGVGMLVRTAFQEGGVGKRSRYRRLFQERPPTRIMQFCERVPMHKGRMVPDGDTATSYMWVVWLKPDAVEAGFSIARRPTEWIAPCRARLERVGDDYDPGYFRQNELTGDLL